MNIINSGRTPTFQSLDGARSSIIDLTLTNKWFDFTILNWGVDVRESSLSDHRFIKYTVATDIPRTLLRTRKLKRADWKLFGRVLEDPLIPEFHGEVEDVESLAKEILMGITDALNIVASPKEVAVKNHNQWWSANLALKRKILRNLYGKRNLHQRLLDKYKQLKKDFTKEVSKAKEQSWRDFCTKAESAKDISKIVQILENPPQRLMSLLQDRGSVLGPEDSLRHLMETHFPEGKLSPVLENFVMGPMDVDFTGVCQFITKSKIKSAFRSFGDYKAAGPDEIPPIALKHLNSTYLEAVMSLYQYSVASGYIPNMWKQMKVVFIQRRERPTMLLQRPTDPLR